MRDIQDTYIMTQDLEFNTLFTLKGRYGPPVSLSSRESLGTSPRNNQGLPISKISSISSFSTGIFTKIKRYFNPQHDEQLASILDEIYDIYLQTPPLSEDFLPSRPNTSESVSSYFHQKFTTLSFLPTKSPWFLTTKSSNIGNNADNSCSLRSHNNILSLAASEQISGKSILRRIRQTHYLPSDISTENTESDPSSSICQNSRILKQVDTNTISLRRSLRDRIGEGLIKARKVYNEKEYSDEVTYVNCNVDSITSRKLSKTLRLRKKINDYIKFDVETANL